MLPCFHNSLHIKVLSLYRGLAAKVATNLVRGRNSVASIPASRGNFEEAEGETIRRRGKWLVDEFTESARSTPASPNKLRTRWRVCTSNFAEVSVNADGKSEIGMTKETQMMMQNPM